MGIFFNGIVHEGQSINKSVDIQYSRKGVGLSEVEMQHSKAQHSIFSGHQVKLNRGKCFLWQNIYFPHGRRFLPVEKISTRGESYFQRAIRFPEGGNFSEGRKCQPCGTIFSVMGIQIPMDLHKFLPSPGTSVGRVSGYRAKGPRFKSRVLLNVITNDFIIFDFSLLKLKFQEIDLKFCLAPIAQLIECQTVDPRVHGSNPVSCLKLSQTILSSLLFLFWNLNLKILTWISAWPWWLSW